MSAPAPSIRARLDALFAKIDAFFAAAHAREGEAITCRAGCADCCRRRFTVTGLEAEVIREGLEALSPRAAKSSPTAPAKATARCAPPSTPTAAARSTPTAP